MCPTAQGTAAPPNPAKPQTVYAFDLVPEQAPANDKSASVYLTFRNRRTFAVADAGVPDGIKLDEHGNI